MVEKLSLIDRMIQCGEWEFRELDVTGIDNSPVLSENHPDMAEEQISLFHRNATSGNEYLERLHTFLDDALKHRSPAPVVRFADGEFLFYAENLHCNGLYEQAESVAEIRKALPVHVEAFIRLSRLGRMAPLVFPGNIGTHKCPWWIPRIGRKRRADSAEGFLAFLDEHNVPFTDENYIPFYAVYAYLASRRFARMLDGKTVGLINSDCRLEPCHRWFARFDSCVDIRFISIPSEFMATRWPDVKDRVLSEVADSGVEFCLVGAGIGSLMVCVDVAENCSIPAVDAGHVVNMLNGLEEKSNGPRLFTLYHDAANF